MLSTKIRQITSKESSEFELAVRYDKELVMELESDSVSHLYHVFCDPAR